MTAKILSGLKTNQGDLDQPLPTSPWQGEEHNILPLAKGELEGVKKHHLGPNPGGFPP